ncbi:MAG TPA: hypothetical protein VJ417_13820, partial [Candidatus Glassbacteria bacterium]|nr:hypothetical protein [Candidatus Glassbacteria bacterium]
MSNARRMVLSLVVLLLVSAGLARTAEIIPPKDRIKTDRPRLLIRPAETPYAVSLDKLRSETGHPEYAAMLDKLKTTHNAACQALVWQMTGDSTAADSAVAMLKRYSYTTDPQRDTFDVFYPLLEYALAYDWVHDYPGFSTLARGLARYHLNQLARNDGLKWSGDHIFHNYIWMSASGVALWALAVA